MRKIKYSYCLNENKELVHISGVTVDNRDSHTYYCLECGQKMVAKTGKINKPHFAHAKDTACNGESYLHKLAKRRIREKFISSDSFPITFVRDVPCQEHSNCLFYNEYYCIDYDVQIPRDLKYYKGNIVYNTCVEEVNVEEFRPDLLLTGPNEKLGKLFIEVFKTHASEESKLNSKHKIIETARIKSEEDIDNIINKGFVEGENCTTNNISPKQLPLIRINNVPIERFILFKSGAALICDIMCDKLNEIIRKDSVIELNFKRYIETRCAEHLTLYQKGLVYLRKRGLELKNCHLCKYYKLNYRGDEHLCVLYKTLGAQSSKPKQNQASKCPKYEENPDLMTPPLSELEKYFSEVVRDEIDNNTTASATGV